MHQNFDTPSYIFCDIESWSNVSSDIGGPTSDLIRVTMSSVLPYSIISALLPVSQGFS